jgi:hypothetical protein
MRWMSEILQGNYRLPEVAQVHAPEVGERTLTEQFEDAMLAKVGGSICFVMKTDTFVWTGDDDAADG